MSLARRQTKQRKQGAIGWWLMRVPVRVRMQSRFRSWSLIRQWVGNPALQEWHTRRSVSRRGPAAGGAPSMLRTADAGLSKSGHFRLLR